MYVCVYIYFHLLFFFFFEAGLLCSLDTLESVFLIVTPEIDVI